MTPDTDPAVPRLAPAGRVRVVLVGIVLPLVLVGVAWAVVSSWSDLPDLLPSHWSTDGADSFLPARTIIDSWSLGGLFAAMLSAGVTIGAAQHWRWTPFGRGASAVGCGIAGGVVAGLVLPLVLARGRTTAEVVALGAAPGVLAVFGGFVIVAVVAAAALPRGRHPVAGESAD